MPRLRRLAALSIVLTVCGDDPVEDPPMKNPPEDPGEGDSDSGGPAEIPGQASDLCRRAPRIGEGRSLGTLRGNLAELGGACGEGGPDAFFRLDVPFRADVFLSSVGVGITPRVGVLPAGCANDWSQRTLACTEGVGTWVLDVAPGTSLVVAVGVDPAEPQLQLPAPGEGDDPLEFALDVEFRNVLAEGERCEPLTRGRCGTGTACLVPPPQLGEPQGAAICTEVNGDTCAQAQRLKIGFGTTLVTLPSEVPHTDAHLHSCTGAHRPDRVYVIELPGSETRRTITAASEASTVGLALRAGGCLPEDERDCARPNDAGARVSAEIAATESDRVYLFVELPPAADEDTDGEMGGTSEEPPITVEVAVSQLRAD